VSHYLITIQTETKELTLITPPQAKAVPRRATASAMAVYFHAGPLSQGAFYWVCFGLGVGCGYWAMFVTVASEQFGTNIRATATTTAPNFVRGAVPFLTWSFQSLKPALGVARSAEAVGFTTLALAAVAAVMLEETYGKDLDYVEH